MGLGTVWSVLGPGFAVRAVAGTADDGDADVGAAVAAGAVFPLPEVRATGAGCALAVAATVTP